MLDQTIQYLTDRGFSKGDAKVNRAALADACIAEMLKRVVETPEPQELQDKGLLASELRDLVLGVPADEEVEGELDALVVSVTAAKGAVQKRLADGIVLCSARITRLVSANGGEPVAVGRAARFLTVSPDVIERFWIGTKAEQMVKDGEDLNDRWDLAVRRLPEMAARRPGLIAKTQQRLQLALEVGA